VEPLACGIFESLAGSPFGRDAVDYKALIRSVQDAEASGYEYYFLIEHQSSPYPGVTAPNVFLAAVAQATERIRLGAMVYQLPFHHPVRLAQDIATLDRISGGRVEFGLGYGVAPAEFKSWNVDFNQRRDMGIEAMEIIRKAWTGEPFSHAGRFWTFQDAIAQPVPLQKPHPRIWMGAHSHASFDYAAEMNFDLAQNIDVEDIIAEKFAYFRRAWDAREHAGPPPRTMIVRHVYVAETDALAIAQAQPYMREGLAGQRGVNLARSVTADASAERKETARIYLESQKGYDFWVGEGLAFVGSPAGVAEQIRKQRARIGYDILLTHHHITTMPDAMVRESQRLFGEYVIPALRETPVSSSAE
jgi:alkanesulfonate monooxygenase SsuD/methylene tetrahydromethanopterin reductase-like flavin-dependent oxidoreductase (luciferase family)